MAEAVRFELTCRLLDNLISSQARYDHFDTSPMRYDSLAHFLQIFKHKIPVIQKFNAFLEKASLILLAPSFFALSML